MTKMTPEDARRVLTDALNDCTTYFYPEPREALAYALSQVWVPRNVAQAVLPLVEDEVAGAKWCDENNPHFGKSNTATWQALADALAEEVK